MTIQRTPIPEPPVNVWVVKSVLKMRYYSSAAALVTAALNGDVEGKRVVRYGLTGGADVSDAMSQAFEDARGETPEAAKRLFAAAAMANG